MCGIAGIVSNKSDLGSAAIQARIAAMQNAIAHRGPDGQGAYVSPSQQTAICHTRLAIIDLTEAGAQPMLSRDQRFAITYNGEIYNYRELRAELEAQGEQFDTDSDTEVLLKLYQQKGADFLGELRGMYAFFIWDEQTKTAFAARDPFGIKPFYYVDSGAGSLGFASEVRSLLAAELHSSELCSAGLQSFFQRGTIAEPYTLIENIRQLPAGHHLTWHNGSITITPYWQVEFKPRAMSRSVAIQRTRAALESTVKAHFVSDVPVGIFLSGGIDSTALVALAKKVTTATINTYSIAFESPEWNEGDIAQKVAEHFGTQHTEFLITPEIAKPLFDKFVDAVDQPTIDGFNTFCVSKLASQAGEKVVLSGVGGDELFAGYASFDVIPKMMARGKLFRVLGPLLRLIPKKVSQRFSAKTQRLLDFLSAPLSNQIAHRSLRGIFSVSESADLTHRYTEGREHIVFAFEQAEDPKFDNQQDQISFLELTCYMRNQLLRDSDVMSMACGLELRVPFVDRELFESIASIPAELRLQSGKKLLIDAVPELPEFVVNRPKQGFRFPFDEWFASQWSDLEGDQATGIPRCKAIKITPWYRRWAIIVIQRWISKYVHRAS